MPTTAPLIQFRDLGLSFGSEQVYAGLDLEIREGELLCLLGPSGCGKSTALRVLAGLLNFDSGSVTIEGATPNERWRDMAFVFQNPRLLPWRTAKENVSLSMELRELGLDRAQREQRAGDDRGAPASVAGARACRRTAHYFDGRALLGARSEHASPHAARAHRYLAAHEENHRLRHP
jgi:ABC-type sugar transport system ATPase subunit